MGRHHTEEQVAMQWILWIAGVWAGLSLMLLAFLVVGGVVRWLRGEKWEPMT